MDNILHPRALRAIVSAILILEGQPYFNYNQIAEHAEYDPRTVARAMPRLKADGIVIREQVKAHRVGGPYFRYRVDLDAARNAHILRGDQHVAA